MRLAYRLPTVSAVLLMAFMVVSLHLKHPATAADMSRQPSHFHSSEASSCPPCSLRFSVLPEGLLLASNDPVQNAYPVQGISFDPLTPVTGDKLRASVQWKEGYAGERDIFLRWKIKGEIVQESRDNVLDHPIHRGDYVEVEVVPPISSIGGAAVSQAVFVENAPPSIRLAGQKMDESGLYEAHVEVADPEGDGVTLSLKNGPPGMTLDSKNGTLLWSARPDMEGSYGVEVAARDTEGAEVLLTYQIKARWEPIKGKGNDAG